MLKGTRDIPYSLVYMDSSFSAAYILPSVYSKESANNVGKHLKSDLDRVTVCGEICVFTKLN